MNTGGAPCSVSENFNKLNELYIQALKINRALLDGGYRCAAPLIKAAAPETLVFFGELSVSFVELIDRIRQLKLEILESIPHASSVLNESGDNYDKVSKAIYEYVFSGFAICMLEKIIREKITSGKSKVLINAEAVWEIFTVKLSDFRLPQLNSFFSDPANADIAAMFNLMSGTTYEALKKNIDGLECLKHNIGVFVREIIEKSIIEGMLLFFCYEEAKRIANH